MKDISLHILDIIQNSVNARATYIQILVEENTIKNSLQIEVIDNGKGIPADMIEKIKDPFYTTGKKKTGMGISLLEQNAELTGGSLLIESEPGSGTRLMVQFTYDHIDRQPLGKMSDTLICAIRANPNIDFKYTHRVNDKEFCFETREIKAILEDITISNPKVITYIHEMINENTLEITT